MMIIVLLAITPVFAKSTIENYLSEIGRAHV